MPKFVSGSSGTIYAPDKAGKLADDDLDESEFIQIGDDGQPGKRLHDDSKKPLSINKRGTKEKQKNSLDLFKEELRKLAEERENKLTKQSNESEGRSETQEDNKHKSQSYNPVPIPLKPDPRCPTPLTLKVNLNPKDRESSMNGSFDTGDPTTTNLYVGNVNPTINENDLCDIFGRFGPLASIKIMWPRTDEERARNRNSGFVAYMSRVDAERALKALNGLEVKKYDMKLGWGKAVPLPQNPVYIPPQLLELLKPPPLSGLPFNAQLHEDDVQRGYSVPKPWPQRPVTASGSGGDHDTTNGLYDEFMEVISRSTVKVTIPKDRQVLDRIHKTIEYVLREGPVFESIIMARELNNPDYSFLRDNQGHEHVYYRWKLYSLLHGDDPYQWRIERFTMFEDGPIWQPPPLNPYADGMPWELVERLTGLNQQILEAASSDNLIIHSKMLPLLPSGSGFELNLTESRVKGSLGQLKSKVLANLLEDLDPSRLRIGSAMVFCIDHADAADEIINYVMQSSMIMNINPHRMIARLFLISDILHNCSASVTNASYYRNGFHDKLMPLFEHLNKYLCHLEDRYEAQTFKRRALAVLGAWKEWTLFEDEFIIQLSNVLLGIETSEPPEVASSQVPANTHGPLSDVKIPDVLEGDLDGEPLDEDILIDCLEAKGLSLRWYNALELSDDELDKDQDIQQQSPAGRASNQTESSTPPDQFKFKTSKWEMVDPGEVAEQVVRLSKWSKNEPSS